MIRDANNSRKARSQDATRYQQGFYIVDENEEEDCMDVAEVNDSEEEEEAGLDEGD